MSGRIFSGGRSRCSSARSCTWMIGCIHSGINRDSSRNLITGILFRKTLNKRNLIVDCNTLSTVGNSRRYRFVFRIPRCAERCRTFVGAFVDAAKVLVRVTGLTTVQRTKKCPSQQHSV